MGINSMQELGSAIAESPDKTVVIYFTATWCGPCKHISPVYESLSKKYFNFSFLKVDVDKNKDIAQKFGVSSMPTFHFVKGTTSLFHFSGANAAKLEDSIKTYCGESEEEGEAEKYKMPTGMKNLLRPMGKSSKI